MSWPTAAANSVSVGFGFGRVVLVCGVRFAGLDVDTDGNGFVRHGLLGLAGESILFHIKET